MSVPNLQSKDQKSTRRVATLATLKDAPLIIVKELMKNTGLLQVDGNFEFLDFLGDCPSPIQTSSGGCRFRVPPAPSAEDPPMPSPCINLSLDKDVSCNHHCIRIYFCVGHSLDSTLTFSANGLFRFMFGLLRLSLARRRRGIRCSAPLR
jgi:hypothetical protein